MGNAATVQEIYEAFGRGDVPAILERLADDVAWEAWPDDTSAQRAGIPWLAERRGPAEVGQFFESLAGLEIHAFEPHTMLETGDRVAAQIAIDATARETGRRFRDEEIHLWVFDADGRVAEFRHYVDTGKHLEAVGAADPQRRAFAR
jgi:uncharacterized protein